VLSAAQRNTRAHLASAEAALRRKPGDPNLLARVDELRRAYRAEALADHIRTVVEAAPTLSPEQIDKLRRLLDPAAVHGVGGR
jgi:hypothetical protein